jgi:hypothetical protein
MEVLAVLQSRRHAAGAYSYPATAGNQCFGGRALARLFLCASHSLLAININMRGLALV